MGTGGSTPAKKPKPNPNRRYYSNDYPYRSVYSARPYRSNYISPSYQNRPAYSNNVGGMRIRPKRSTSAYARSDYVQPVRRRSPDNYRPLRNSNYSYNTLPTNRIINPPPRSYSTGYLPDPPPINNYLPDRPPINNYPIHQPAQVYQYVLVVSLKGNSMETYQSMNRNTEIIEVTIIIVNNPEMRIVASEFHSYVQPKFRRLLDQRCKENYSIYQFAIDQAQFWPQVEEKIEKWLRDKGINTRQDNFIIAADGETGYDQLIRSQCQISGIRIPDWSRRWVNIRKEFRSAHKSIDNLDRLDTQRMASIARISLEGSRKGAGRDEAFDLANIVLSLLRMGHIFEHVEQVEHMVEYGDFYNQGSYNLRDDRYYQPISSYTNQQPISNYRNNQPISNNRNQQISNNRNQPISNYRSQEPISAYRSQQSQQSRGMIMSAPSTGRRRNFFN